MQILVVLSLSALLVTGCVGRSSPEGRSQSAPRLPQHIDPTTLPVGYRLKADAPAGVRNYWDRCQSARAAAIHDVEFQMELIADRRYMSPTDREQLVGLKELLTEMCQRDYIREAPLFVVGGLQAGDIGEPSEVVVLRIIDHHNMICRVRADGTDAYESTIWVTGPLTTNYVDGSKVFTGPLRITGRRLDGGETMYVAEPFRINDYLTTGDTTPARGTGSP